MLPSGPRSPPFPLTLFLRFCPRAVQVEVKTTKNTERRVQRCIVLEDGRIIEHDDPHIVVDTIEDTQTHDFDHLEDQSLARELQASIKRSYQKAGIPYNEAAAAAELKGQQRKAKKDRRKSLMCEHPETYVKNNKNNLISGDVVRTDTTEEDGSIVNDTFKRIVNTHDVRGEDSLKSVSTVWSSDLYTLLMRYEVNLTP